MAQRAVTSMGWLSTEFFIVRRLFAKAVRRWFTGYSISTPETFRKAFNDVAESKNL